jgi:hypothetical protein
MDCLLENSKQRDTSKAIYLKTADYISSWKRAHKSTATVEYNEDQPSA